jgi:biopolymer transport protein ExbD
MDLQLPNESESDHVPMAPMIDMVFLLLVFFMVASHMNRLERVEIGVPVAEHARRPKDLADRRTITVREDGQLYLGSRPSSLEEITPAVERQQREVPGLKIYLRADKDTDHGKVRAVMKACAEGGASEIIFAAYETE